MTHGCGAAPLNAECGSSDGLVLPLVLVPNVEAGPPPEKRAALPTVGAPSTSAPFGEHSFEPVIGGL
ncbi:hypothetical protein [Streptomyces sp. NPDC050564]|uniref:hypothetical protein n=1 Tax=Streptomyces sp. NPDC050564 TaxID=3365631 RepID=UPI00379FE44A